MATPTELVTAATATVDDALLAWHHSLARPGGSPSTLLALLDDWAEFSGMDHRAMLADIAESQQRIDDLWVEQSPTSHDEVSAFYDQTDALIPLHVWWHGTDPNPAVTAHATRGVLQAAGCRTVLDFGGGIGSSGLHFAAAGLEVTIAEVAREVLAFAQHRFATRDMSLRAVDVNEEPVAELAAGSFDAVVSFDVFEHVLDLETVVDDLDRVLGPSGVLVCNQAYVGEEDELQHFPRRGEVLDLLHDRGYRLGHLPGVLWVAQRATLSESERKRQRLEIKARVTASQVAERLPGPLGSRLQRWSLD